MEFKQNLKMYQDIVNNELEKYLRKEECPEKTLNNSMEYSLINLPLACAKETFRQKNISLYLFNFLFYY